MGSRYLTDLADVCRRTGYPVVEVDDWQRRARGSGGYDSGRPNHVMEHHTASGPSSDGWPDVNYCTFGDEDAPLCNLYVSRNGTIYVCAGGATNTNGSGSDPCGVTADDSMNSSAIGIECGNDGVGERWSDAQLNCLTALTAELCAAYAIPIGRIHSHREWAPTRKTDPAGPDRYASGAVPWNMDAFRSDCGGPVPPIPNPPNPTEDDMAEFIIGYSGADTDGAMYSTTGHTKTWLADQGMVDGKTTVIALNGGDPAPRPISDRNLFRGYGPVIGPRPERSDDWGLPV